MENMFNVTTVLPHNLLQTNPCIRHNFSTQVFRKRAAQLNYVGPELRYIFWPFLASFGGRLLYEFIYVKLLKYMTIIWEINNMKRTTNKGRDVGVLNEIKTTCLY